MHFVATNAYCNRYKFGAQQDKEGELGRITLESFNRKACPGCALLKTTTRECFVRFDKR